MVKDFGRRQPRYEFSVSHNVGISTNSHYDFFAHFACAPITRADMRGGGGGGAIDPPPKNFSIPRLRYSNRAVTLIREAAQVQSWIFSSFSYFSNILSAVNISILGLYNAFWYTGSAFTRYFNHNNHNHNKAVTVLEQCVVSYLRIFMYFISDKCIVSEVGSYGQLTMTFFFLVSPYQTRDNIVSQLFLPSFP